MKKVVFTFGRMNPPTSGHQLLVNKLMAYAKMHSGIPRVYLSHSIGKKDPLPYDIKVSFARKAFGAIVRKSPAKNIIQILKDLEKEKFTDVTLIVGSDRVQEFKKLLNTYNGKEYQFDNINVVSAGERDPDADDVSGMSASKMRALVKDDNLSLFMNGAPSTLKAIDRKKLFNSVRKFMLGEDVMDYNHDERFVSFIIEASRDDSEISMPSSEEIERYLKGMDIEDLDLADEDALLYDVITGEPESDDVQENKVLSVQARQKLSQRMKFMSKRLARLRQIKSKTMPAQQRLRLRARKAALMILRRRATGKKDLDYSALSRSQRVAVDNALVTRFGNSLNTAVDRISKRILPDIRKKAQASVAQARDVKEAYLYEKEIGVKKAKDNAEKNSPLSIDVTKLDSLSIDPTKNDRTAPNPKQPNVYYNKSLYHEGRKSSTGQDGRDEGDTNIIYQMRKTINSRGEHETVFADDKKAQISIPDAKKIIAKFDSLRMPADRQRFTIIAGKSLKDFKDILAHGLPKEQKKKISLGGKKISEFYMGVGRNRTASPYDGDEPPGIRRVAEAAKDEDRPENPNRSRPLSQKLDLLLRLGIADSGDLQKYRRALRSNKKQALQSPEMREKLVDLLDKLIDLTTQDPATYSRVRYRVMTKEAMSLLNKAEASGIDISILGEVFARGYKNNENINEAFNRVNSFIAGGRAAKIDSDLAEAIENKKGKIYKDGKWIGTIRHRGDSFNSHRTHPTKKLVVVKSHKTRADAEKHIIKSHEMGENNIQEKVDLPQKYRAGLSDKTAAARKSHFDKADKLSDSDPRAYEPAPGDAAAKTKPSKHTIKFKKMYGEEAIDESSDTGLAAKSKKSGISIGTLRKVYNRGMAAWNSGHRPGTTPQQWAMARVNSYIGKGKGTYYGADKDLRGESVDEACWDTHKQVGMKKKGNRMVPDCVPKEEVARRADIKMIKVKLPDGRTAFRKERPKTDVQMEAKFVQAMHKHPTGKIPYDDITNKQIRDDLKKKVKSTTEAYTGSESTTNNMADPANRFVGTDAIRKNYASMTPGQEQAAGEISVAAFSPEKQSYISPGVRRTANEVDQSKQEAGQKSLKDIRKALSGVRESNDINQSFEEAIGEAIYQGRSVTLNKPMQGDVKKSKVYVRDPSTGNIKKVNFGDKNLSIKKDQPARKRSYCARSSGQGNLAKKTSANYWSRRAWNC